VLDVDCFKLYNDRYGHLQGDTCLRQIADCASTAIQRSSDLVARYGGEEFVVVLPNTDSQGARTVAEEIRMAVERLNLPHDGNPHERVTVSAGCATHYPEQESAPEMLFRAADQALYRAKAGGRNRIETASEVLTM
jgi:diguanylate cyclase (GGDEF)-like protein